MSVKIVQMSVVHEIEEDTVLIYALDSSGQIWLGVDKKDGEPPEWIKHLMPELEDDGEQSSTERIANALEEVVESLTTTYRKKDGTVGEVGIAAIVDLHGEAVVSALEEGK
jgi:hypothetical protein